MRFRNFFNEAWYHGSPDVREIEKAGGFDSRTISVDYIEDPIKYHQIQNDMAVAREEGNEDKYFDLLHSVSKSTYKYTKPIFLTDVYSVAKTYADPHRSFDYQGALEKVYEVDVVDCEKIAKISAYNKRFRFLDVDSVKRGFVSSGVPEKTIDKLISMFNFYTDQGIKTDVIGAIASWLKFDCVDFLGVLDSYHGGKTKSTVRMVLDPAKVKIRF
jgi:hypothetical protein